MLLQQKVVWFWQNIMKLLEMRIHDKTSADGNTAQCISKYLM